MVDLNVSVESKSLDKLNKTLLKNGIGAFFRLFYHKEMSGIETDATVHKTLALAQADFDAKQIGLGLKKYDHKDQTLISKIKNDSEIVQAHEYESVAPVELVLKEMEAQKVADDLRKDRNVTMAIIAAQKELEDDEVEPSPDPINEDWLYRWRDYASGISSEELQSLWGKILAGECKSPGIVSLRTMDFIRNLSTEESRLISEIAPFVTDDFVFLSSIVTSNKEVTFELLHKMEQLGILSGVVSESLVFTLSTEDTPEYTGCFSGASKGINIESKNYIEPIDIPVYFLTKIGDELIQLCNVSSNAAHFEQFAQFLRSKEFSTEIINI